MDKQQANDPFIGQTLLGRYTVVKKLGEGSFGRIYKATSLTMENVALKVEKRRQNHPLLLNESSIMSAIPGRIYYLILLCIYFFFSSKELINSSLIREEIKSKTKREMYDTMLYSLLVYE